MPEYPIVGSIKGAEFERQPISLPETVEREYTKDQILREIINADNNIARIAEYRERWVEMLEQVEDHVVEKRAIKKIDADEINETVEVRIYTHEDKT